MEDCNGCSEHRSELKVNFNSDNLVTNCKYCSILNSELRKDKDEILSYKEIIKVLQEELST
jgi:hypothetical protein